MKLERLQALEQAYAERANQCMQEHYAALGAAQAIHDLIAELQPALSMDELKQATGLAEIGEPQPIEK